MGAGAAYEAAQSADFIEAVLYEALGTKAGVDGHEHDDVEVGDDVLEGADGRGGVEGDGRAHASLMDLLHGAVEMDAGFLMDVHDGGAEVAHLRDEFLGLHYHEVYVEGLLGETCHVLEDGEAEGDVGHEDTVHDVEVEPVGLGTVEPLHLATEVSEVGSQEAGRYEVLLTGALGAEVYHSGRTARARARIAFNVEVRGAQPAPKAARSAAERSSAVRRASRWTSRSRGSVIGNGWFGVLLLCKRTHICVYCARVIFFLSRAYIFI